MDRITRTQKRPVPITPPKDIIWICRACILRFKCVLYAIDGPPTYRIAFA